MKLFILSCLLILIPFSDVYYATVIGVADGDSIVILTQDNQQIKIRLEGIDCPEPDQDFGQKARQATVALCFNKKVRIEKSGVDRYGRTLAFVYVGDLCVNNELLKQGLAWHYIEYNHDTALMKLEADARSRKIGLWSIPEPTPPWDFRHK
jgi:endonuclease YncB( thermonuclease family)